MFEDTARRSARSAGNALLKNEAKIPAGYPLLSVRHPTNIYLIARVAVLKKTLSDFFDEDEFDRSMIEKASALPVTIGQDENGEEENFVQHGEKVIKLITEGGGIDSLKDFEVSWRQHFLDVMKPKFLPEGWNLYHNHERIDVKLTRERKKEQSTQNDEDQSDVESSSRSSSAADASP